ncbi:MAG: hypothetical protein H2069_07440 [Legionella sp.]|nr:hypothetical protein [Legionella sp.]
MNLEQLRQSKEDLLTILKSMETILIGRLEQELTLSSETYNQQVTVFTENLNAYNKNQYLIDKIPADSSNYRREQAAISYNSLLTKNSLDQIPTLPYTEYLTSFTVQHNPFDEQLCQLNIAKNNLQLSIDECPKRILEYSANKERAHCTFKEANFYFESKRKEIEDITINNIDEDHKIIFLIWI